MATGIKNLAQTRAGGLQPVVDTINQIMQAAIIRYNSEIGPRTFGRPESERIPTDAKLLTTFRTRIGSLIEYAFGVIIDQMMQEDDEGVVWSYDIVHEYPDFYIRDADSRTILLRIDFKVLHSESAEYSARFDLPLSSIDRNGDLLIYLAWRWEKRRIGHIEVVYPVALDALCIPAYEIATERDLRLTLTGGIIDENGTPLVPSKSRAGAPNSPRRMTKDSNFGKVDRIVHSSRKKNDLTINLQMFLAFINRYTADRTTTDSSPLTPDEEHPLT